MATTLRVSEHTRAHAAALAEASGQSVGSIVDKALQEYERAEFWRQTASALAARDSEDADVSYARCEDIRAVSERRLTRRLGAVDAMTLIAIGRVMRTFLEVWPARPWQDFIDGKQP